jgi:hypothetical protein
VTLKLVQKFVKLKSLERVFLKRSVLLTLYYSDDQIEKNVARSTYGREKTYIQGFGGET